MITFKNKPGERVLELGGGDVPQLRPNADCRPGPQVDMVMDFNKPLPLETGYYGSILSKFAIEHISWRNVSQFIAEVYRALAPGGTFVCIMPNTAAQMQWIFSNPNGWDDKGPFEAASEVLYGSQDYPENSHKAFFSPGIVDMLFKAVGFTNLEIHPYGERETDMCVRAEKPHQVNGAIREMGKVSLVQDKGPEVRFPPELTNPMVKQFMGVVGDHGHSVLTREEMFDKHYFNGGKKVGGYALEGYWDYPVHEITVGHILDRRPTSVLELGCARNYLVKKLQDRGIKAVGMEISKHCWMTRAADPMLVHDLCKVLWPIAVQDYFDLAFSIATFEHIPEEYLPGVLSELNRVSRRGLHGIDFGEKDDGFDKTHCTLRNQSWWRQLFDKHGLLNHEIVNKEDLERGNFPQSYFTGDGKVKLNIGCHIIQFHNGWENVDVLALQEFSQHHNFKFRQHNVNNGLPYATAGVDLIYSSHFLEHLTYDEGLAFLRECRRVLKPGGCMRLIVPDAKLLNRSYAHENCWDVFNADNNNPPIPLSDFDCINDECEKAKTSLTKLHALLYGGDHKAVYDEATLSEQLMDAGFDAHDRKFRAGHPQILKETLDTFPSLSLFTEATY